MSSSTVRRGLGGSAPSRGVGGGGAAVVPAPREAAGAKAAGGAEEDSHPATRRWGWDQIKKSWGYARQQPQAGWTNGQGLLTKGVQGALVMSMLCGPVGVGLAVAAQRQPAPVAAAAGYDERVESRRSAAEYVAREWVVAWLSAARGQESSLLGFWPGRVDLPKQGSVVHAAQVVSAAPAEVGVWAVTVRADLEPVAGAPVVTRYFQVPVSVQGEGQQASAGVLGLPSQVPGPLTEAGEPPTYGVPVAGDSPLGSTVTAFLSAALTGRADEVARYTAPDATVRAAISGTQGGYAAVAVTSISAADGQSLGNTGEVPADGATARVKADVGLTEKGGDANGGRTATWFLSLTTRAGRWEVSAIDQSPVVPTDTTQGENR